MLSLQNLCKKTILENTKKTKNLLELLLPKRICKDLFEIKKKLFYSDFETSLIYFNKFRKELPDDEKICEEMFQMQEHILYGTEISKEAYKKFYIVPAPESVLRVLNKRRARSEELKTLEKDLNIKSKQIDYLILLVEDTAICNKCGKFKFDLHLWCKHCFKLEKEICKHKTRLSTPFLNIKEFIVHPEYFFDHQFGLFDYWSILDRIKTFNFDVDYSLRASELKLPEEMVKFYANNISHYH